MNQLKKQEYSLYITLIIAFTAFIAVSGNPILYFKMLGYFVLTMGVITLLYKGVYKLLDKKYPDHNTITKGAVSTIIKNISYEK